MSILKNSLIYKLVSGFFVACRNSRIVNSIAGAFKGSLLYKVFFVENDKMMIYASHSKFLGNRKSPKAFTIDKSKSGTQPPKYLSWLYGSFFMKMILTWKDCEHDDQYT